MYDKARYLFPRQKTPYSLASWTPVGLRKFYAYSRGYAYVEEGIELGGYEEEEKFKVLQNDKFEQASDWAVGANSALSIGLAFFLFFDELTTVANAQFFFITLVFQQAVRVLFNSIELAYTSNANSNKYLKLARNALILLAATVGLTALILGTTAVKTLVIHLLPVLSLFISLLNLGRHIFYAISNFTLMTIASNPLERERYRTQLHKSLIQASSMLVAVVVSSLVLLKEISIANMTLPISAAIFAVHTIVLTFTAAREHRYFKEMFLMRRLYNDVDQHLNMLANESLDDKVKRYNKPKELQEKVFWHTGGILEELKSIKAKELAIAIAQPLSTEDIGAELPIVEATPCESANPYSAKEVAILYLSTIINNKIDALTQDISLPCSLSDSFFDLNNFEIIQKKIDFLHCLLNIIGEKESFIFNEGHPLAKISTLIELEAYLNKHDEERIAIFSAPFRKTSNTEAIYRGAIQYHKLFPTESKTISAAPCLPIAVAQTTFDANHSSLNTIPIATPIHMLQNNQ